MLDALQRQLRTLRDDVRADSPREAAGSRAARSNKLDALDSLHIHASRIRCHGDYHLGQVLTARTTSRSSTSRASRRSPSICGAESAPRCTTSPGMLRSFHYAATVPTALANERSSRGGGLVRRVVSLGERQFLCAYLRRAPRAGAAGRVSTGVTAGAARAPSPAPDRQVQLRAELRVEQSADLGRCTPVRAPSGPAR